MTSVDYRELLYDLGKDCIVSAHAVLKKQADVSFDKIHLTHQFLHPSIMAQAPKNRKDTMSRIKSLLS